MRPTLIFNHVAGIGKRGDEDIDTLAALDDFNACAVRFATSFSRFEPQHDYDLVVVVSNGDADEKVKSIYRVISGVMRANRISFLEYTGTGWDIGAHQWAAQQLPNETEFVICMSARTHFNRAGWLKWFMDARKKHGEGLYSTMASYEACPLTPDKKPNPHLRTAFFGMNPRAFKAYPNVVNSREDTFEFESGEYSISRWFKEQGKPVKMVCWSGEYDEAEWRTAPNVFRKGDQSDLIAHDRHSAIYNAATDKDKKFLETISDGGTPE